MLVNHKPLLFGAVGQALAVPPSAFTGMVLNGLLKSGCLQFAQLKRICQNKLAKHWPRLETQLWHATSFK